MYHDLHRTARFWSFLLAVDQELECLAVIPILLERTCGSAQRPRTKCQGPTAWNIIVLRVARTRVRTAARSLAL
jgi:hypothetical protein